MGEVGPALEGPESQSFVVQRCSQRSSRETELGSHESRRRDIAGSIPRKGDVPTRTLSDAHDICLVDTVAW